MRSFSRLLLLLTAVAAMAVFQPTRGFAQPPDHDHDEGHRHETDRDRRDHERDRGEHDKSDRETSGRSHAGWPAGPPRHRSQDDFGPPTAEAIFDRIDADRDGQIDLEEFEVAHRRLMERVREFRESGERLARGWGDGHRKRHRFHRGRGRRGGRAHWRRGGGGRRFARHGGRYRHRRHMAARGWWDERRAGGRRWGWDHRDGERGRRDRPGHDDGKERDRDDDDDRAGRRHDHEHHDAQHAHPRERTRDGDRADHTEPRDRPPGPPRDRWRPRLEGDRTPGEFDRADRRPQEFRPRRPPQPPGRGDRFRRPQPDEERENDTDTTETRHETAASALADEVSSEDVDTVADGDVAEAIGDVPEVADEVDDPALTVPDDDG